MEQSPSQPFILVLEENPEQAVLIQNVFREGAVTSRVKTIAESTEALNFIHRRGEYTQAQRPDLILLNLRLKGCGRKVLEELKSNADLRRIPVIILTDSDDEEDIFRSYLLQGNSYVINPRNGDQLHQVVQRIKEFWLGIVTLPLE